MLLTEHERVQFAGLMDELGIDWGAIVVVDEECAQCRSLLDAVERVGMPDSAPLVAMSTAASPAWLARLNEVASLVVVDAVRLDVANLNVRPFVLLVDRQLAIQHKQVGGELAEAVVKWRAGEKPRDASPVWPDNAPSIVHSRGRSS